MLPVLILLACWAPTTTGDADGDGYAPGLGGDCDDHNLAINPDVPAYLDADGDRYGDTQTTDCTLPTVAINGDCDDGNDTVYPRAPEACDGIDHDCDGAVNEHDSVDALSWYADADGDGYGEDATLFAACSSPRKGWVQVGGDCDDASAVIYPGAPELCDSLDNDCDGTVDEDSTWYADADGDGWGAGTANQSCIYKSGSGVAGDCDDTNPALYPGAPELCDGLDSNCDGVVEGYDADHDGFFTCDGECDDFDPVIYPGAQEVCNGKDDDCDGVTDNACVPAPTCTIHVPDDYPAIQDAIDASVAGDVICVSPGTYSEKLNFGGKAITVEGTDGPDVTIIDGADAGLGESVVTFDSGETATTLLRGVTIENGRSGVPGDPGAEGSGGGVDIDGSSPRLDDLIISGNESQIVAGGVRISNGNPTISHCVITGNTAESWAPDSSGTGGYGGGLYLVYSDPLLLDVTIENNVAEDGATYYGQYGEGDGVDTVYSSPTFERVSVTGNGDGGWGEGVAFYASTPRMDNVLIAGNAGVGIYVENWYGYESVENGPTTQVFTNVAVLANTAGAFYAMGPGNTSAFVNSIIASNSTYASEGSLSGAGIYLYRYLRSPSTVSLTSSDVYENRNSDGTLDNFDGMSDPTGTDGNISVDPMFLTGSGTAAYHLDSTSPLIDAGDPSLFDPDGSVSDVGMFGGEGADQWDLDDDGYRSWWLPGEYSNATSPGLDCDDGDKTIYPGSGC